MIIKTVSEPKWKNFEIINSCCKKFKRNTEKQWDNDYPLIHYNKDKETFDIRQHMVDWHDLVEEIKYCPFCGKKIIIEKVEYD